MYIRHPGWFLQFGRPMRRRIGRLKNYKIMSSERAGLNKELGVLAFTLSSLAQLFPSLGQLISVILAPKLQHPKLSVP